MGKTFIGSVIAALLLVPTAGAVAAACPGKTIRGTAVGQTLKGTCGPDVIYGLGGNDKLIGLAGNDKLYGGPGNDVVDGGPGGDVLSGALGKDTAIYPASPGGVKVNLSTSPQKASGGHAQGDKPSSIENVTGSNSADTITGSSAANILEGGKGADKFVGGLGNDFIVGGLGADTLTGNAGNDSLYGNVGFTSEISFTTNNTINGGPGADDLFAANPSDLLSGGADGDILHGGLATYQSSPAAVHVNLATGTATGGDATGDFIDGVVHLRGSAFDDELAGSSHVSTLDGREGADTFFGDGVVSYFQSPSGVTVDLSDASPEFGGFAGGDVININMASAHFLDPHMHIIGSAHNDNLTGSTGIDQLVGGGGDDLLDGGAGNDLLRPGPGNDGITGGADDGFVLSNQLQYYKLGDIVFYTFASTPVTLNLSLGTATGEGADTLGTIETVYGSPGDDTITGNSGKNALVGDDGSDTLSGLEGSDFLEGGTDGVLDALLDGGTGGETFWTWLSPGDSDPGLFGDICSDAESDGVNMTNCNDTPPP